MTKKKFREYVDYYFECNPLNRQSHYKHILYQNFNDVPFKQIANEIGWNEKDVEQKLEELNKLLIVFYNNNKLL
jgi:hypothetical protein